MTAGQMVENTSAVEPAPATHPDSVAADGSMQSPSADSNDFKYRRRVSFNEKIHMHRTYRSPETPSRRARDDVFPIALEQRRLATALGTSSALAHENVPRVLDQPANKAVDAENSGTGATQCTAAHHECHSPKRCSMILEHDENSSKAQASTGTATTTPVFDFTNPPDTTDPSPANPLVQAVADMEAVPSPGSPAYDRRTETISYTPEQFRYMKLELLKLRQELFPRGHYFGDKRPASVQYVKSKYASCN